MYFYSDGMIDLPARFADVQSASLLGDEVYELLMGMNRQLPVL